MRFLDDLSEQSRYERFLGYRRAFTDNTIKLWVNMNDCDRMAFAAVTGQGPAERFLGVARYARAADGTFEFAVAVSDAYQGRGIGWALMQALRLHARQKGIKALRGDMFTSNAHMRSLARRMGMSLETLGSDRGLCRITLTLSDPEP